MNYVSKAKKILIASLYYMAAIALYILLVSVIDPFFAGFNNWLFNTISFLLKVTYIVYVVKFGSVLDDKYRVKAIPKEKKEENVLLKRAKARSNYPFKKRSV